MANIKQGFIYYTIDVNRYEDVRIKRLIRAFSCKGMAIYDHLLCEIYKDKGCYVMLDKDTSFFAADKFNIEESTVSEIIKYCGSVGLFNKELLSRGIITSVSIQLRYKDMCDRSRRKCYIPDEINLINHKNDKQPIVKEEKPVVYDTVREQISFLLTDDAWVNHICDNYKIQDLQPFFTEFEKNCTESKKNHGGDVTECRKHFVYWLRKYLKNHNDETISRTPTNAGVTSATQGKKTYDSAF